MRIIADLHIHSRYSRATSPKLTLPYIERWAKIKGINLVGTGDCTHPAWLGELNEQLEPTEGGFFRLKDSVRKEFDSGEALTAGLPDPDVREALSKDIPLPDNWFRTGHRNRPRPLEPVVNAIRPVRFVLSGEISTIYARDGKTRKVHHVVILPDFKAAAAFQARLARIGNISSDGRPILGLDSRDLFALLLDADERSILIPAHIWTPWFSALGARSGFDSIEECYGDLSSRIGAIETGLSSNPPMNWAVSSLDRFAIISNSDAHSPENLGREATIFEMENSFDGLSEALTGRRLTRGEARGKVAGTIEFFPQEGKYHYDGHRTCGVVLSPLESAKLEGRCPVCGKPLTPGVMRRVTELADRPVDETAPCPADWEGTNRRPYWSLIPLPELLAELLGTGSNSKKVASAYRGIIEKTDSEFALLMDKSEEEIEAIHTVGLSGELLALSIRRMRSGKVLIKPGYDGEYGIIHVFAPGERIEAKAEQSLFIEEKAPSELFDEGIETSEQFEKPAEEQNKESHMTSPTTSVPQKGKEKAQDAPNPPNRSNSIKTSFQLNPAQEAAIDHYGGPALVIAGPGTGKTAILALRIARILEQGLDPSSILAITFTNKAAAELRKRIELTVGAEKAAQITAKTFHSFCLSVLREHAAEASLPQDFVVLNEEERFTFLKSAVESDQDGKKQKKASSSLGGPSSSNILGLNLPSEPTTPALRSRKIKRLASYVEERKRFLLLPGDERPRLGPSSPAGLAELAAELGCSPSNGPDPELELAYARYRDQLKQAHALDFDDLVAGTVRLLSARPALLASYRERFRAIFVDEYQDVNFAQYALIRLLVPDQNSEERYAKELYVIGDPNQAIYGFRGSDKRFIERFIIDYPDAAVYRLLKSFRCAPAIIAAAGRLAHVELSGSGAAVALSRCEFPTDASEAESIAREIDRLIGGTGFFAIDSGVAGSSEIASADSSNRANISGTGEHPTLSSLGECAILIRTSALAPPIEKALIDHGIPYRFIGDKPWWEEEPTRSVLIFLRTSIRTDSLDASMIKNPIDAVRFAIEFLNSKKTIKKSKATAFTDHESSYSSSLERLIAQASLYNDLSSFLDDLALGNPQDGYEANSECISLMTIHAAKGLEFDYVFVPCLEDGLLPFTLFEQPKMGCESDTEAQEQIEEERRLLYVAMTRARIGLYLSWARSRHLFGRKLSLPPSRFLADIENLVPLIERRMPPKPKDIQLTLF
ncbi:MAG TPA: UvrD-helicase domain-containing protein [Rectinema sp.]|nr:UvrD-helicase domain-containing protein [Rectinema sp.]HQE68700.1 UvrD-helicase domain-containing protein [Rectinema sp.]HRT38719.1 UvrD-helicase domain-containing protein [Rectinema sp.]HRU03483.1 UvrD-helicase domain-containing protein [Rectinema sp.]